MLPEDDVSVYSAQGHLDGEMMRIFLESQGISARLSQESAGLVHGFTVGPLGMVDILVPASQAAQAVDLIERMLQGEFELPAGESEGNLDDDAAEEDEV